VFLAVNVGGSVLELAKPFTVSGETPPRGGGGGGGGGRSAVERWPALRHFWAPEKGARAYRLGHVPTLVVIGVEGTVLQTWDGRRGQTCPADIAGALRPLLLSGD
jgi:hypothetical protein